MKVVKKNRNFIMNLTEEQFLLLTDCIIEVCDSEDWPELKKFQNKLINCIKSLSEGEDHEKDQKAN